MLEIKAEQMNVVVQILNTENEHYPLLKAILSGKKKGNVYVNNLKEPSVAGVISEDGWFYLLGNEGDNSFNTELEDFIIDKITRNNIPILWFGIPESWRRKLNSHDSLKIGDFPRIQYEFDRKQYSSFKSAKFPYCLELINEKNVQNLFEHRDDIRSFWDSPEAFIKHGLGFIIMDDGRIIGHAISASVEDREVEIDIKSDELYRGKGIATFLASCLIDECIKRGLIPKWDCAAGNLPSKKLAMKLGFKEIKEYPFSFITLN